MKGTIAVTLPSQDLEALNNRAQKLGLTPSQLLHRLARRFVRPKHSSLCNQVDPGPVSGRGNIWEGEWITNFTELDFTELEKNERGKA